MNWRSEKYRRLVAALPCLNCGRQGLTQAAHANSSVFGKSRGMKSADWSCFPLCHVYCHTQHDQHKSGMSKVERIDYEGTLIAQTLYRLYSKATGEYIAVDPFNHEACQAIAEAICAKYTLKELRAS